MVSCGLERWREVGGRAHVERVFFGRSARIKRNFGIGMVNVDKTGVAWNKVMVC